MTTKFELSGGIATGVGSLPHRDPTGAAMLSLTVVPDLPFIPSLPRRSVHEGMLAQAAAGMTGVRVTRTGELQVDPARFDPEAPVTTDLAHEAYASVRAFLALAVGRSRPVKWQVTGPVTLALALVRGGADPGIALRAATAAVRQRVLALHAAVAEALPAAPQVVWLDEPATVAIHHPGFPVGIDEALDAMATVLASLESRGALTGLHCCARTDWSLLVGVGPGVVSAPIDVGLETAAAALTAHLERGGWVAWGAVPTTGPLGSTTDRLWRDLAALWCAIVRAGCDPVLLRQQALITPACGLSGHGRTQAGQVLRLAGRLAERVHAQAIAARFSLGA